MKRRSFFATLAAPLLVPLRKLVPKPAAPVLNLDDYTPNYIVPPPPAAQGKTLTYFWGYDGLYILGDDGKTVLSHQPYPYWHGQAPFVKVDLKPHGATWTFESDGEPFKVYSADYKWEGFRQA